MLCSPLTDFVTLKFLLQFLLLAEIKLGIGPWEGRGGRCIVGTDWKKKHVNIYLQKSLQQFWEELIVKGCNRKPVPPVHFNFVVILFIFSILRWAPCHRLGALPRSAVTAVQCWQILYRVYHKYETVYKVTRWHEKLSTFYGFNPRNCPSCKICICKKTLLYQIWLEK